MKKFILSVSVILVFLGYTVYQKNVGSQYAMIDPKQSAGVVLPNPGAVVAEGPITKPSIVPVKTTSSPKQTTQSANVTTQTTVQTNKPSGQYVDGQYVGDVTDAFYGNVQVQATVSGGKLTNVQFLSYPNDRGHSVMINSQAMPLLVSEAIQTQNANVNIISGATDTSQAFIQSLGSALSQAKS